MDELNYKYWKKMTIFSSAVYCRKMLELSKNPYEKCPEEYFNVEDKPDTLEDKKNNYVSYMEQVIGLHKKGELFKDLDNLKKTSPFPLDLQGVIHEHSGKGIFQPIHLMYKIASWPSDKLHRPSDKLHITFEFLIEYGILESDVEIYYGIKAISDSEKTTEDFEKKVFDMALRGYKIKKEALEGKGDAPKFDGRNKEILRDMKFTNNVHDGTFWIVWCRMQPSEDFPEVAKNMKNTLLSLFNALAVSNPEANWDIGWNEDEHKKLKEKFDEEEQALTKRRLRSAKNDKKDAKNDKRNENDPLSRIGDPDYVRKMIKDACEVKVDGKTILSKEGETYRLLIKKKDFRCFVMLLTNKKKKEVIEKHYDDFFSKIVNKGFFTTKGKGVMYTATCEDFIKYLEEEKFEKDLEDMKEKPQRVIWKEIRKLFVNIGDNEHISNYNIRLMSCWLEEVKKARGEKTN